MVAKVVLTFSSITYKLDKVVLNFIVKFLFIKLLTTKFLVLKICIHLTCLLINNHLQGFNELHEASQIQYSETCVTSVIEMEFKNIEYKIDEHSCFQHIFKSSINFFLLLKKRFC